MSMTVTLCKAIRKYIDQINFYKDGRVTYVDKNGRADLDITAIRSLFGRVSAHHKSAQLDGSSRLISGDKWNRNCHLQIGFELHSLSAYVLRQNGAAKIMAKTESPGVGLG